MLKWNDKEYSSELILKDNLRIYITSEHIYHHGSWIMQCYELNMREVELKAKDMVMAKTKAILTIETKLKKWLKSLEG